MTANECVGRERARVGRVEDGRVALDAGKADDRQRFGRHAIVWLAAERPRAPRRSMNDSARIRIDLAQESLEPVGEQLVAGGGDGGGQRILRRFPQLVGSITGLVIDLALLNAFDLDHFERGAQGRHRRIEAQLASGLKVQHRRRVGRESNAPRPQPELPRGRRVQRISSIGLGQRSRHHHPAGVDQHDAGATDGERRSRDVRDTRHFLRTDPRGGGE